MVLRKLSQSLKVAMALMVATFSSGLLAPAMAVGALSTSPNNDCSAGLVLLEKYNWNSGTESYMLDTDSDGTSVSVGGNAVAGTFSTSGATVLVKEVHLKGGQATDTDLYPAGTASGSFNNSQLTSVNNGRTITHGISNIQFCGTITPATPTGSLDISVECEEITFSAGAVTPAEGSVSFTLNSTPVIAGEHTVTPGEYTLVMSVNGTVVDTEVRTVVECQDSTPTQLTVNPASPAVTDVCGTSGDSVMEPQDSEQVTYSLNGNVVTATLVNHTTHDFGAPLNGYVVAENGLTATYTAMFPNNQPCVTPCPAVLDTIHSTNQDTNGWTLIRGAEYVDGGMKLTTPGDWVSGKISRDMSGTLGDLGDVISYSPDTQYLGLHIQTSEGWLTYESIYGGNLWLSGGSENMMSNAPHTGGGQGSPYYGTLEEWATAFPELEVLSLVVLYTNSSPASVTVTSVTIGCVEYTFDKEDVVEDSTSVTLCHATGSEKNPFVRITVSAEGAFNGHLGDGHHNGEDIIPFFTYNGETHSQNWTEGMVLTDECDVATEVTPAEVRFLNPTCENPTGRVVITATEGVTYKVGDTVVTGTVSYPGGTSVTVTAEVSDESYVLDTEAMTSWSHTFTATPTGCVLGGNDVCPNIEGTQSVVPTGMIQNTMTGECFTPGGRGGVTPAAQVLGTSTQALPETLPSTGGADSPLAIIIASILAYGAAYFLQGRRLLGRKEALSA